MIIMYLRGLNARSHSLIWLVVLMPKWLDYAIFEYVYMVISISIVPLLWERFKLAMHYLVN